jgi:hypothetical protein
MRMIQSQNFLLDLGRIVETLTTLVGSQNLPDANLFLITSAAFKYIGFNACPYTTPWASVISYRVSFSFRSSTSRQAEIS